MRAAHLRPPPRAELRPHIDRTTRYSDLPLWTPTAPRGGWTPATAREAARAYADRVAPSTPYTACRVYTAAHHALLAVFPGLYGADLVERLQAARAAVAAEEAATDAADLAADPAPF